jgi:hypothetical protein
MIDMPDDNVLKAVTGLEGGCVACGSTCGIVSNGALGLSLLNEEDVKQRGTEAKKDVMRQAGEYMDWFKGSYGSLVCRDLSKADFYSVWGQLMYFLSGRRLAGCFWHIRGATRHLYLMKNDAGNKMVPTHSENKCEQTVHCAQTVLEGIRKKTGIGDQRLEELSFVFDGGVGFSGGICGALVGAITGINLLMGIRIREQSYWETIKDFIVGHVNLLNNKALTIPEPFRAGKLINENFEKSAGSIECSSITGQRFAGWDEFQEFITGAKQCQELMDFAIKEASEIIKLFK